MDSQTLFVFPLQLIVFPGERIPLHIFEPRYRRMVAYCESTLSLFGIIPIIDRKVAGIGTTMLIEEVRTRYGDGRMDIVCRGDEAFQVDRFEVDPTEENAHRASVRIIAQDALHSQVLRAEVQQLYYQFQQLLNAGPPRDLAADQLLSYQIGHLSGLSIQQKAELLGVASEQTRLEYLQRHLQHLIPTMQSVEETRRKVNQNGHFRVIPGVDFKFD